jgi:hypothetical protein
VSEPVGDHARERDPGYAERLAVPLRWWALATMFLASVLLAFLVALPAQVAFAGAGALAAATVAVLVGYGGATVVVHDGHLAAGRARIPVTALAGPEALGPDATRRALGPEADARAYLLVRPYLRESVRVTVVDPGDPTPYWLVSTRHPGRLASAIDEAITATGVANG